MNQRLMWLIFPFLMIAASVWLVVRPSAARAPIAIVSVLSIVACVRQVSLFWRKGQTTYASIVLAAILITVAVTLVVFLRS
jgi:hypothetical protein